MLDDGAGEVTPDAYRVNSWLAVNLGALLLGAVSANRSLKRLMTSLRGARASVTACVPMTCHYSRRKAYYVSGAVYHHRPEKPKEMVGAGEKRARCRRVTRTV